MDKLPSYERRNVKDLKDMVVSSIEIYKDKPAFWVKQKGKHGYQPISYNQLRTDMNALGTALIDIGLKGKRIAIIGENRYEWAVSYLAIVTGTGIVVPIDKELPQNEITSLIKRAEVDAIIFSGNNYSVISEIAKDNDNNIVYINMDGLETEDNILAYKDLISKGKELVDKGDTRFINAEINAEEMSILLFTSATTDKSKAVMLSHKNICTNLMAMTSMVYIDPSDIFFSVLPLHHTYECTCGFLCPIYRGSSIAYCEGLRHIQKNLQESKATVMLAVPLIFETMYKRIWDQVKKNGLDKKLKIGIKISNLLKKLNIDVTRKLFASLHDNFGGNIRLFISGAAGINPAISKGYRDLGIFFLQGYGLTECSPIVALNSDKYFKDDAAGYPMPSVEVKINQPNENGIGEIIVKGENVMLGYYGDSEATDEVLKDGWFYTGDLGFIDEDGFVHITGRKKYVIVTKNGKNIYPEEIETLLNESPYIKESMIYGKKDPKDNDVVISAAIVPDFDKIQNDHEGKLLTKDEIYKLIHNEIKQVNKKLVTYKYIRNFNIRENEFAKTTTKKIKRYLEKIE
ncbi:MAG: AMP-binding protein [Clostridiaceae bacterium]|nr:AMP-binding protein [Clostridiaceae bacterium]